jgi:hypothetical protein
VVPRWWQNSSKLAAGVLGGGVLRPGDAGQVREPGQDCVAELGDQPVPRCGGDLAEALLAGGVPGADQPAQRQLRLGRPHRVRPGLACVLEVADQVRARPDVSNDYEVSLQSKRAYHREPEYLPVREASRLIFDIPEAVAGMGIPCRMIGGSIR